jgi:hypothetical protein
MRWQRSNQFYDWWKMGRIARTKDFTFVDSEMREWEFRCGDDLDCTVIRAAQVDISELFSVDQMDRLLTLERIPGLAWKAVQSTANARGVSEKSFIDSMDHHARWWARRRLVDALVENERKRGSREILLWVVEWMMTRGVSDL